MSRADRRVVFLAGRPPAARRLPARRRPRARAWGAAALLGLAAGVLAVSVRAADRPRPRPAAPSGAASPTASGTVLFRGATVWTMGGQGILPSADVLVRDGKIAAVGRSLTAPSGAIVVPGEGRHLTPGIIDAHSHTAVDGGVNEGANTVTAEVRIADVLDPTDIAIYRELAGGVTAANVLHGSANAIGGQTLVIKLRWGQPATALPFEGALPGIKFALGENPKRSNFDPPPGQSRRYPTTRMGVAAAIRRAFVEAKEYRRAWQEYEALPARQRERREPPRRDIQKDALVEVLEGKRLVHAHCYRQDEILMLIRLSEEIGFHVATFQHVLEGYKVADEIAASGAGASTFSDWWAYKIEAWDAIPWNGALMAERGVVVSFNSDSDEQARRLNLEAAKAIRYGGLKPEQALALVTINPARQLKIDSRVGSIEVGKDADLALWSGDPLSVYSACEGTWVDGVKRFDRAEDLAGRTRRDDARADLIARVKSADKPSGFGAAKPSADRSRDTAKTEGSTPADSKSKGEKPPARPAAVPLPWHAPEGWGAGEFAIVGATVHPVSGPAIENGAVVVRNGAIAWVGPAAQAPAVAETIRLEGRHLWPGILDADTVIGLTEIGSVRGSVDIGEVDPISPDNRVELAVNPDSEIIPVTRAGGITHAAVGTRGGLIGGTAALIRLDGWTWEDLTVAAPAALRVDYPEWETAAQTPAAREERKKQREKALKDLQEAFAAARAYRTALRAESARGAATLRRDPALEAIVPALDGRIPVHVEADSVRQIRDAVAWAEREGVRMVLLGGRDAWRVADLLREKDVPVILDSLLRLPARRDEDYDVAFAQPERLRAAGVRFCLSGGGASNERNLPFTAGMAAAYGLPRDIAVRSVTLSPAEILGVADKLGSIEPGKSASLVATDGDLLEIRTHVERVWIDGRPADLGNRHQRLYDRYRTRPKPARPGGAR